MVKSEAAQLVGYVNVDMAGRDVGGYLQDAKAMVEQNLQIPPGYHLEWSGAFVFLWLLGYHLSVAVWVGIIALAGVDAETGVVMLLYLDHAYERRKREGHMQSLEDLEAAVQEGAVQRVRPKMMTVLAILMGLLPIMWSGMSETGADMMKRIAAPMIGGVITSFIMELVIYPAVYTIWKWWAEVRPSGE